MTTEEPIKEDEKKEEDDEQVLLTLNEIADEALPLFEEIEYYKEIIANYQKEIEDVEAVLYALKHQAKLNLDAKKFKGQQTKGGVVFIRRSSVVDGIEISHITMKMEGF